jgi:hypothetical protein
MAEPRANRPPTDTVRVANSGILNDATWVNILWLKVTRSGTPAAADLLNVSNALAAAFRTRFGPYLSTSWTQKSQRAVWFTSDADELGVDGSDTGSGSLSDTYLPASVAILINWAISGTYRGGHPRTYLAGITVGEESTAVNLHPTTRTNVQTAAGNFLSDVNALSHGSIGAVSLGTVAFFRGHSALSPPIFKAFTSASVSPKYANQRRRVRR